MKTAQIFSSRSLLGLAVTGVALLSASGASAQTPSPFYAFMVNNLTSSNGGPVYSVFDSVDFNSLAVNEAFADGFTQSLSLPTLQTQDTERSSAQVFTTGPGGFTDPVHGALTSAVLTGSLAFPGISPDGTGTIRLTVLPSADPSAVSYQQLAYTSFSADLFGANPTGIAVGTFKLENISAGTATGSGIVNSVNIDITPVPAAVPEASTSISLGLLLMLGLGGAVIARRKRTAAAVS